MLWGSTWSIQFFYIFTTFDGLIKIISSSTLITVIVVTQKNLSFVINSKYYYSIFKIIVPIRKFPVIVVLPVEELDGVRILFRHFPPLQAFFYLRNSVTSAKQVQPEYQNDQDLDEAVVDEFGEMVPEKDHDRVVLVVQRIVDVGGIHAATAKQSVNPGLAF